MARNRNNNTVDESNVDVTAVDENSGEGGSTPADEATKRGFHGTAVTGELPADFKLPEPDATSRSNNNPITAAVRAAKDALGVWQQTHVESKDVDQARQHLRSSANRLNVGVHIHPATGDSDQIENGKVLYWHTKEKAVRKAKDASDTETVAETSPESAPDVSADTEPSYA